MLITNEHNKNLLIDTLYTPIPSDYFWILDIQDQDFMLSKLTMLEEVVGPTIWLKAGQAVFPIPTTWNVLIYSEDTAQMDIVDATSLTTGCYTALVGGMKANRPTPIELQVVDYKPEWTNICPAMSKHQMLCHPISNDKWIMVSPADAFNKYLKDAIAGDYF